MTSRQVRSTSIRSGKAYNFLVSNNIHLSWLRRVLEFPGYWALADYAKRKLKTAVSFIFLFEDSAIYPVRGRRLDGAICSHRHGAVIKEIEGVHDFNYGDWVDCCSASLEYLDGRLELVLMAASLATSVNRTAST